MRYPPCPARVVHALPLPSLATHSYERAPCRDEPGDKGMRLVLSELVFTRPTRTPEKRSVTLASTGGMLQEGRETRVPARRRWSPHACVYTQRQHMNDTHWRCCCFYLLAVPASLQFIRLALPRAYVWWESAVSGGAGARSRLDTPPRVYGLATRVRARAPPRACACAAAWIGVRPRHARAGARVRERATSHARARVRDRRVRREWRAKCTATCPWLVSLGSGDAAAVEQCGSHAPRGIAASVASRNATAASVDADRGGRSRLVSRSPCVDSPCVARGGRARGGREAATVQPHARLAEAHARATRRRADDRCR